MSKKQSNRRKVNHEAPNLFVERMEEFMSMFPEVLTEGKIDLDKLKTALGEETDGKPERYSFTWAGKKDAIRLLQVPSRATLIPDKDESINFDTTQNIFVEKNFVEGLEKLDYVRLYLKLPNWFTVLTPVGEYNPDWAIVMEDRDEFGNPTDKPLLYLVRETKDTLNLDALRPDERRKILCGEQHFKEALKVDYKVVTSASELP